MKQGIQNGIKPVNVNVDQNPNVCNNKQRCNNDKCRCECKELIGKGICDKGFIWNPSNCKCACNKSCDVGEYLDYENCKCRKKLVDKLVKECNENTDEKELHSNEMISVTLNNYKNVCRSCTIDIVLLVILFICLININCAFVYFYWNLKKDSAGITNINPSTETVIY